MSRQGQPWVMQTQGSCGKVKTAEAEREISPGDSGVTRNLSGLFFWSSPAALQPPLMSYPSDTIFPAMMRCPSSPAWGVGLLQDPTFLFGRVNDLLL